jgi:hypothetical protein
MDGARVVRIAHTHRTKGNYDPCGQIVEIAQYNGRKYDTKGYTNGIAQIVTINKTLICPDIIHCTAVDLFRIKIPNTPPN